MIVQHLFRALGLHLLLALMVLLAAPAQAQPVRSALPADVETVILSEFPFPREIAGLGRGWKVDYNTPGLGFSVHYGKPGDTWADIYVYDLGQELPTAPAPGLARSQRDQAIEDVQTHVKNGNYQRATVLSRTEAGAFAQAHLRIAAKGRELDSFVFVTVRRGMFVKIRLSTNAGPNASKLAQAFLQDYGRVLKAMP